MSCAIGVGAPLPEWRGPTSCGRPTSKPWRFSSNAERLDSHNGLLLLPQYDHLFDRGYITFRDDGRLEPSPAIAALSTDRLGIDLSGRLSRVEEAHLPFLEYHREEVFVARRG
ncbi:HNH endonuclease [Gaopeijia maritima]|uniref:HNH endonuclease n=1 Tax=Gaopeijia maritima TaxID=3119007 RepID=UPI00386BC009